MTYEQWLACLCLWREARSASVAAMTAIWWVIKNRSADPMNRWPKTIPGVILQPLQFSSFNANDPNVSKFPKPDGSPDWAAFVNCQTAVNSASTDTTKGATNYESIKHPLKRPAWADPSKITLELDGFRFYRLLP